MRIREMTLHNFRSIDDAKINLGNYSLLVGANNSGKSNVIDSLRVFYEKGLKFEDDRDFPKFKIPDKDSWMEIEFYLNKEECKTIKEDYIRDGNRLRVRKYYRSSEKGADGKPKQGIYAYIGDSLSDDHFYGVKSVQQGKLGDLIYIPAVSRLEEHTKLSGPSALRDLLNDIIKKLAKSSQSFKTLEERFETFAEELKREETDDKKSLSGLEKDINDEIGEWDAEFRLDINAVDETEIVKNLVSYKILDKALGQKLEAAQFGQGFQRHLIYTLIRMVEKYQTAPVPNAKKDFAPDMTLLLFEEPEAFLHPAQQNLLCKSLRTLAESESNQVIISSHSPIFVSHNTEDIPSIVRLCRDNALSKIGQIDSIRLKDIFADNQRINDLVKGTKYQSDPEDLREDMEAIKYFLWLDTERCGLFFSKQVLLIEGPTEKVFLNYLINNGKIKTPKSGVFVLDCIGKFNMHRFMNLLGPLNIPHSVLFDSDGGKTPHESIKKLIEESKNEYTYKIETFPTDIEAFLGVPKTKDHRKPQHLMLQFKEEKIDPEKIEKFVSMVNNLIQYP